MHDEGAKREKGWDLKLSFMPHLIRVDRGHLGQGQLEGQGRQGHRHQPPEMHLGALRGRGRVQGALKATVCRPLSAVRTSNLTLHFLSGLSFRRALTIIQ